MRGNPGLALGSIQKRVLEAPGLPALRRMGQRASLCVALAWLRNMGDLAHPLAVVPLRRGSLNCVHVKISCSMTSHALMHTILTARSVPFVLGSSCPAEPRSLRLSFPFP